MVAGYFGGVKGKRRPPAAMGSEGGSTSGGRRSQAVRTPDTPQARPVPAGDALGPGRLRRRLPARGQRQWSETAFWVIAAGVPRGRVLRRNVRRNKSVRRGRFRAPDRFRRTEGSPGNGGSREDQPGGGRSLRRRAERTRSNPTGPGTRSIREVSLKHAKRRDSGGGCEGEGWQRRRRAPPEGRLRGTGAGAPSGEGGNA